MPQKAWSNKDERQYEHIKESASKGGRSSKRAKQIAAATVNKQRSEEGRTMTSKSKGRGARATSSSRRQETPATPAPSRRRRRSTSRSSSRS